MTQLGLERKRGRAKPLPSTTYSLPDLGPIFQDFKKKNPEPTPVEQFSKAAETILANYDALKPGQIKGPERAKHLDLILSGLPGAATSPKATRAAKDFALKDYNKWFLGYDPGDPKLATPALAASLLNWTPLAKGEPLPAPTLKSSPSLDGPRSMKRVTVSRAAQRSAMHWCGKPVNEFGPESREHPVLRRQPPSWAALL
ncbi:MAG: hypothetical protein ACRD15_13775 [Vicinamibacterales bacterium]